MSSAPGIAVPGTTVPISSLVSSGGAQGIQGLQGLQGPTGPGVGPVQFLSAAYNLTSGDSGKYVICSGGSWALGLPTPASLLNYRVRNDMGITGTTGTITITPVSGTIDGLASLALLPGQECTVYTDGTNWRTFGRQRTTLIGTIDITSAVANVTFLLPVGYRLFEIELYGLWASVERAVLNFQLSSNGGSSFITTGYYYGTLYGSTASAPAFSAAANTANSNLSAPMGHLVGSANTQVTMKLYPSDGTREPSWIFESAGYDSVSAFSQLYAVGGFQNTPILVNAMQITASSGTINGGSITVKGMV